MSELINRVRHRIDTTENWVSANPILKEGEMGLEKTPEGLRLFKVGDGVTPWMDLEYISGPRGPQGPEGNMPARFSAHTNLKATTDDYGHVLLDEFSPKGFSIAAPGGYGIGVEGGSPILGGTDLDTLTRPGFYSSASEDVSSSLSNCPTAKAFDFVVSSTSYGPRQELHEVNNGKAFWRNKKSSTEFHPWQVLPTGITDSTSIESSVIAASATAVKVAYDIGAGAAALAAQANASAEAAAAASTPATTTSRGIGRVATAAEALPGSTITNGPAFLDAGTFKVTPTPTPNAVPQADATGDVWGLAKKDMSNLSQVGTTAIAHAVKSSERKIEYTLTWGQTYIAPADGVFNLFGKATATTQARLDIYSSTESLIYRIGGTFQNQTMWGLRAPLRKGDRCIPLGDAAATGFRFIYDEGAY